MLHRDLSISNTPTPMFPNNPLHWTQAELEEWKQAVSAAGALTSGFQRRWDAMLASRKDGGLEGAVRYRTGSLPPAEVLAEVPLYWLAYRENPRCPGIALLGCRIAELAQEIANAPLKGSNIARERLRDLARRMVGRRRIATAYVNGVAYVGGLRIRVHDQHISIHVDGTSTPFVTGPAHEDQLPRIQRLVSAWIRFVRLSVASALQHAVPVHNRTLSTPLTFALPTAGKECWETGIWLQSGRLRADRLSLLPQTPFEDEAGARYAVAGTILDGARQYSKAVDAIDLALCSSRGGSFVMLPRLKVSCPTRTEVMSRLDDTGRSMIRPLNNGCPVDMEKPADAYEIWQDSVTGPRPWVTVRSFALAVDLEASNRVVPAFRMGLRLGGGQIRYAAETA